MERILIALLVFSPIALRQAGGAGLDCALLFQEVSVGGRTIQVPVIPAGAVPTLAGIRFNLAPAALNHARQHFRRTGPGSHVDRWQSPEAMILDPLVQAAIQHVNTLGARGEQVPVTREIPPDVAGTWITEYDTNLTLPGRPRLMISIRLPEGQTLGSTVLVPQRPGQIAEIQPRGRDGILGIPVVAGGAAPRTREIHLVFAKNTRTGEYTVATVMAGPSAPPPVPRALAERVQRAVAATPFEGNPSDPAALRAWHGRIAAEARRLAEADAHLYAEHWTSADLQDSAAFWAQNTLVAPSARIFTRESQAQAAVDAAGQDPTGAAIRSAPELRIVSSANDVWRLHDATDGRFPLVVEIDTPGGGRQVVLGRTRLGEGREITLLNDKGEVLLTPQQLGERLAAGRVRRPTTIRAERPGTSTLAPRTAPPQPGEPLLRLGNLALSPDLPIENPQRMARKFEIGPFSSFIYPNRTPREVMNRPEFQQALRILNRFTQNLDMDMLARTQRTTGEPVEAMIPAEMAALLRAQNITCRIFVDKEGPKMELSLEKPGEVLGFSGLVAHPAEADRAPLAGTFTAPPTVSGSNVPTSRLTLIFAGKPGEGLVLRDAFAGDYAPSGLPTELARVLYAPFVRNDAPSRPETGEDGKRSSGPARPRLRERSRRP